MALFLQNLRHSFFVKCILPYCQSFLLRLEQMSQTWVN